MSSPSNTRARPRARGVFQSRRRGAPVPTSRWKIGDLPRRARATALLPRLVLASLLVAGPAWRGAQAVPAVTYRCTGNMVVAGFPITLAGVTVNVTRVLAPSQPGPDGAPTRQTFLAIANSTAFDAVHAVGRDASGFYIDAGHPANAALPTRGYFDRDRLTGAFHNRHGDALYLTCR